MVEARSGPIPEDATTIICTNAAGKTSAARVYHDGADVVFIAPPGEAAVFNAKTARAAAQALGEHAASADSARRGAQRNHGPHRAPQPPPSVA